MCGCMRVCRMSSSLVLQLPQWHSRVSALAPETTDSLLSSFLPVPPARHDKFLRANSGRQKEVRRCTSECPKQHTISRLPRKTRPGSYEILMCAPGDVLDSVSHCKFPFRLCRSTAGHEQDGRLLKYLGSPWRADCCSRPGTGGAGRAPRTAGTQPPWLPAPPWSSPLSPLAALSLAALYRPVPPLLTAAPCTSMCESSHEQLQHGRGIQTAEIQL